MASGLYTTLYEVKGEVRLQASSAIQRASTYQPGALRLSQLGDAFFIQCVHDSNGKPSKRYKLDREQLMAARLVARDGRLTFYIPANGSARFNLQKSVQNDMEEFMSFLDEIKIKVLTKAAAKSRRPVGDIAPIPRVNTLFGSKEEVDKPMFASRGFGHQRSVYKTPEKVNEANMSILNTPNEPPQEELSHTGGKGVSRLASQQENHPETPGRTAPQKLSFHEAKELYRSKINSQQSPNKAPKILSHPNNIQKQKSLATERTHSTIVVRPENDLEKENINFFVESPEKKRTPEKQSDMWSTFGSPRKKTPLKENESGPRLARTTNSKAFYGKNNGFSSIQVKRVAKKSVSSSSPSVTPKNSLFSTTPTAAKTQRRRFSDEYSTEKQSAFSSYFSEVTSQGFTNLGNTCYMNATLQSILGLVPFVQELQNDDILNNVGHLSLYNCMYGLLRCKNEDGASTRKKNALKRLKRSLKKGELTKRFSGNSQNDAHEFMNICLEQMKEEVWKALGEKPKDIVAKVCPVIRNFEGCLRKYIHCKGCNDVSAKEEEFNHLSLNIPKSNHLPSELCLTRLLGRFFEAEELERKCDKCDCPFAVQYLKILTLPRVIILHLLRSEFNQYRGTQAKNSHRIRVDRFLEVGSFCCKDISGPAPFVPRNTSPLKSNSVPDNETPFSDDDVIFKPRRRLNMSAAVDESSCKSPKKGVLTTSNSKKYPDWVYAQAKRPTLSTLDDSSDDDDIKKAKLASLREVKEKRNISEELEIKLATLASLQEKPNEIEYARIAGLGSKQEGRPVCHSELRKQTELAKFTSLQETTAGQKMNEHHQEIEQDEVFGCESRHKRIRTESLEGNHTSCDEEQDEKFAKARGFRGEATHSCKNKNVEHEKIKSLQGKQEVLEDYLQIKPTTQKQIGFDEELGGNIRTTKFQDTGFSNKRQVNLLSEEDDFSGSETRDSEGERVKQAISASLRTQKEEEMKSACDDISDAELMEIAASLEERALSSDSGINVDSNARNTTRAKAMKNREATGNRCSQNKKYSSGKRTLFDSDVSALDNTRDTTKIDLTVNGGATEQDTPSKRRKVQKNQTDNVVDVNIDFSYGDEDMDVKKAIEISMKEHEQTASEESQLEKAIRMSLEDGQINASVKDADSDEDPLHENMNVDTEKSLDEFSYGLVSVVSHVGSSASVGHYISSVYDIKTNQWTRYDDITAKKVKEYDVRYDKVSDGYIYFYMHKSCIKSLLKNPAN